MGAIDVIHAAEIPGTESTWMVEVEGQTGDSWHRGEMWPWAKFLSTTLSQFSKLMNQKTVLYGYYWAAQQQIPQEMVMNIPEEDIVWEKYRGRKSSRSSQRTNVPVCSHHKESVKEKWDIKLKWQIGVIFWHFKCQAEDSVFKQYWAFLSKGVM